ncbi:MAG TPA: dTDP-4-dehydrorhamnose reductase [Candidatus Saccharimonadales bacterium]|nr:dTDP-4-dehydrorhamnose reductase [Candidatus Saccharimonadales bacterium]
MTDESKIVITGAGGQLGLALQQKYPNAQAATKEQLDITNADAVRNYDWQNIELIINAAGYTNVDGAETDEGRVAAWQVNANAVANLARAATEHGLTLVHISTEYVFDGTKSPHKEDEPFSPLSVYGASKAGGDVAGGFAPKHYIVRTSWLIGEGGNFVRTMLELGKSGTSPTVVSDQIGRLTFTNELVKAIDHLLNTRAPYGTYNVSNSGEPASWGDIARAIFQEGNLNIKLTNTTTSEYLANKPEAAKRPLNSTLDLSKIEASGFKPTDWREDLRQYIKKELPR